MGRLLNQGRRKLRVGCGLRELKSCRRLTQEIPSTYHCNFPLQVPIPAPTPLRGESGIRSSRKYKSELRGECVPWRAHPGLETFSLPSRKSNLPPSVYPKPKSHRTGLKSRPILRPNLCPSF